MAKLTLSHGWATYFPGDASVEAYRREMRKLAPVGWDVIESSQGDLLRLLVGRVAADIGAQVLIGLSVLFSNHPKAEQVSRSMLASIMSELDPRRARTLLVTIVSAWRTAERRAFDLRATIVRDELARACRRLAIVNLNPEEQHAIWFLQDLIDDVPD